MPAKRCLFAVVFMCLLVLLAAYAPAMAAQERAKILSVEPFFNSANEKGALLELSQKPESAEALKEQLRVFPPVGFFSVYKRYHKTKQLYEITGKFVAGKTYELTLLKGKKQFVPEKIKFTAKGFNPCFMFASDRSVLELYSRQLIPFYFTNVGDFKISLLRIPALFSPNFESASVFAMAADERPQNSSDMLYSAEPKESLKLKASVKNKAEAIKSCYNECAAITDPKVSKLLKNFLLPKQLCAEQAYRGSEDPDKKNFFSLPLDFRPSCEIGGAVLVFASETNKTDGAFALRLFQITDLSLTYKFSKNELLVWVTSIETGKPCPNASVMLVDKNDNRIFIGQTNKDGIVTAKANQSFLAVNLKHNKPVITTANLNIPDLISVSAATPNDSAFTVLNANRLYSASAAMCAPDMRKELSMRAHLFTERGVYRPGETVYFKAAAREIIENTVKVPQNASLSVKITNPTGEAVYEANAQINDFGTFAGQFNLSKSAKLGEYTITLNQSLKTDAKKQSPSLNPAWNNLMNRNLSESGKNENSLKTQESQESENTIKTLYSTSFQVQEFEAPRHLVDINITTQTRTEREIAGREAQRQYMVCKITSKYYAGGALRHAKVRWAAKLTENSISNADYPFYAFGSNDKTSELLETGQSILDKNGELTVALPLSQNVLSGLNAIEFSAAVLDADGKSASQVKRFAPPVSYKVGISRVPNGLPKGSETPIEVLVLNKDDKPVEKGEIQLEIMRSAWFYTQKRGEDGEIFYSWNNGWVRAHKAIRPIKNGKASFNVSFGDGGDYMLLAAYSNENIQSKAAQKFYINYSYEGFQDYNKKSHTRSENEIFLTADKKLADVESEVTVKYSLPQQCQYALITAETDHILSHRVIKLNGACGEFKQTLSKECCPNVFIGFIAPTARQSLPTYKSETDTDFPRAYFGCTSVKVQNKVDTLNIEIAPNVKGTLKAAPGETQKISFSVEKNGKPVQAELAVCAANQAVLDLTGFVVPVLNTLTDFSLPLSVFTGDLRVSLITQELYRLLSTRALTGGGEGLGAMVSDIRKDFKPIAYFNAQLLTDQNGKCEIEFKTPDTLTSYNIYAVGITKDSAFSSASRQMVVSKDFYIEPGLPQFMTQGDKMAAVVNIYNNTKQSLKASIEALSSGSLAVSPLKTEMLAEPNQTSLCKLTLNANGTTGIAELTLNAVGGGLSDAVKKQIKINPAFLINKRNSISQFTGSCRVNYELPEYIHKMPAEQLKGTVTGQLSISLSPWAALAPTLKYLLNYPYGCAEQTSSALIPLIAIRELAQNGEFLNYSLDDIDKYIAEGFSHLSLMQRDSGGFAYWPSEANECWWASQYAILAMSLAKKQGINFEGSLDKALNYTKSGLFKQRPKYAPHASICMAALNLALNGRLSKADFDSTAKLFKGAKNSAEGLLLWAEGLVGETEPEVMAAKIKQLKTQKGSISASYQNSAAAENALALLASLAVGGPKEQANELSAWLLNSLKGKCYWCSTADTGLALYALLQYMKQNHAKIADEAEVKLITIEGEKTLKINKSGVVCELSQKELLAGSIKIEGPDKALMYYGLEYAVPSNEASNKAINKGFEVIKTVKNIDGGSVIRVGDIVKVSLEFQDSFCAKNKWAEFEYVYIEDPIPAGFAAINPNLKNEFQPPEGQNEKDWCSFEDGAYKFYADFNEMRPSVFSAFKTNLWSGRFRLEYYMRAANAGEFKMKPTQVGLMYNDEYYGLTPSKTIVVSPSY